MKEKVLSTIRKNKMIEDSDKVIVALSGGPDSVCLLHVLNSLKEELGITLYAAHINHCLRGEDADKDEAYCKKLCQNLKIEFFVKKIDVHKLSVEKGISCEMAGREVRYAFFYELKEKLKAQKIAIAHNCNDQAETIIMRIMRGTGLEGMVGIRPVREGIYIRPIIEIDRADIEDYCEKEKLNPRIDKTNLENIYSRNKVRLEMIPYIKEHFNEDIINTLNRMSHLIQRDNDFIEKISYEKFKKYCDIKNKTVIMNYGMFSEDEAIVTRVIRMAIHKILGNLNNFESSHIEDIIHLQRLSTGKKILLPKSVIAENSYDNILIYINNKNKEKLGELEYLVPINDKIYIDELNMYVETEVVDYVYSKKEKNHFIKEFHFDISTKNGIIIRYPKEGDVFTPLGMKGSKKLNRFFIDSKIPREMRDKTPLLCINGDIAWIVGHRMGEKFKITKDTNKILRIKFSREG